MGRVVLVDLANQSVPQARFCLFSERIARFVADIEDVFGTLADRHDLGGVDVDAFVEAVTSLDLPADIRSWAVEQLGNGPSEYAVTPLIDRYTVPRRFGEGVS